MLALFISTSDTEFVPYNTMLQYFYEQFTKQMYPICLLTPKNYKLLPHLVMGTHSIGLDVPDGNITTLFLNTHGTTNLGFVAP